MSTINIMSTVEKYLLELGVKELDFKFIKEAKEVSFVKLSHVNIIKNNRTTRKSHQTHIHITGESMKTFYESSYIKNRTASTDDTTIKLTMFTENIKTLEKTTSNTSKYQSLNTSLLALETVKKIAYRSKTGGKQVQLSKRRKDSESFIDLRSYLYEGDIVCFFRLHDNYDDFFIVVIPSVKHTLTDLTSNQTRVVLQKNSFTLKKVSPDTIVSINKEFNDDENFEIDIAKQIDAIKKRKKKTYTHETIVKNLAAKLTTSSKISIFSGNIDCLAIKGEKKAYIFEVKTLSDIINISEEKDQVRKAFAQLAYYDLFAKGEFKELPSHNVAVFSRKISDEHISFFTHYGYEVLWLEDNQTFSYSDNFSLKSLFN